MSPAIQGLKSQQVTDNFHVLGILGDDFAFQNAKPVFDKWSEIETNLKTTAANYKYDLEIFYSSLPNYFDLLSQSDAKFNSYKGDFIPYIEPMGWQTDYWTGFYTS